MGINVDTSVQKGDNLVADRATCGLWGGGGGSCIFNLEREPCPHMLAHVQLTYTVLITKCRGQFEDSSSLIGAWGVEGAIGDFAKI